MGRRLRPLAGIDRAGLDGQPVGLQRHGAHHSDRRMFIVYFFHETKDLLRRTPYAVGFADTASSKPAARSICSGAPGPIATTAQ